MLRSLFVFSFFLISMLPSLGQATDATKPGLPKEPREVFAAAAPFYDFNAATLKPWHLKATYQLYDEKGKPSEQGTYEYWWASPQVYRSTWTRAGTTHTDWHTEDGNHAYQATGERLKFFEYKLQAALLSPLPDAGDLDSAKIRLDREFLKLGDIKLPCIMAIPLMPQQGHLQIVPLGLFPTYCFDPQMPVLRFSYFFGNVTTEFNQIVKVQGKYLAREIVLAEGERKILSATVDSMTGLSGADPALKPPPNVASPDVKKVDLAEDVIRGSLLKKQIPVYPQDAKNAHVSGTVVLRAIIGVDGGVHDLHVISAPWPSLAASALWAVSRWEYKPYFLNGQPVEVETSVKVIYSLGN